MNAKHWLLSLIIIAPSAFAADIAQRAQNAAHQAQIQQLHTQVRSLEEKLAALEARLAKKDSEIESSLSQQVTSLSQRIDTKAPMVHAGDACLRSSNGHALCMQNDGNLVVYNPNSAATFDVWGLNASLSRKLDQNSSGNNCIQGGAYSLCMQPDGNLVIYGSQGSVVWHR